MSDNQSAPVSSPGKDSSPSDGTRTSTRPVPVFFRVPMGWKEMSEEDRERFLDEAAAAIMGKAQY